MTKDQKIKELEDRIKKLEDRPVYVPYPVYEPLTPPNPYPNPFPPTYPGVQPTWFGDPPYKITCLGLY